jgi:hypothetical protein
MDDPSGSTEPDSLADYTFSQDLNSDSWVNNYIDCSYETTWERSAHADESRVDPPGDQNDQYVGDPSQVWSGEIFDELGERLTGILNHPSRDIF